MELVEVDTFFCAAKVLLFTIQIVPHEHNATCQYGFWSAGQNH